jgi:hypothetical protein
MLVVVVSLEASLLLAFSQLQQLKLVLVLNLVLALCNARFMLRLLVLMLLER